MNKINKEFDFALAEFEKYRADYELLMKTRPYLFSNSEIINIVTDREQAEAFFKRTGRNLGVVYKSQYNYFVVDLIKAADGTLYTYERLIKAEENGAVVTVPRIGDRFILLRQYRHALRDYELSFPRGNGERNISPADNAVKELTEEISACVISVSHLGSVVADSGICGTEVDIFVCDISGYDTKKQTEGITKIMEVDENSLEKMIRSGEIKDCYTITGYYLFKLYRKN